MSGPAFSDPLDPSVVLTPHGHPACGARLKQPREDGREFCTHDRGWGTDHPGTGTCKLHFGATPNGARAAAMEVLEQGRTQARRRLGVPDGIDPTSALVEALAMARNDVLFFATEVGLLDVAGLTRLTQAGEAKPVGVVVLYRDALKEYAKQAAECVRLGIEAAAVSVVQAQGEQLIRFTRLLLERLGVDPAAPETVVLVQEVVRTIERDAA